MSLNALTRVDLYIKMHICFVYATIQLLGILFVKLHETR